MDALSLNDFSNFDSQNAFDNSPESLMDDPMSDDVPSILVDNNTINPAINPTDISLRNLDIHSAMSDTDFQSQLKNIMHPNQEEDSSLIADNKEGYNETLNSILSRETNDNHSIPSNASIANQQNGNEISFGCYDCTSGCRSSCVDGCWLTCQGSCEETCSGSCRDSVV